MKYSKLIEIARNLYHLPVGRQKHFSFIMRKNKILSFGYNNSRKTDPLAARFGHRFAAIHSEIMGVKNFQYPVGELENCTLINIRLLNDEGRSLALSRPCEFCQKLLGVFNLHTVIYSNEEGGFSTL